MLFITQAAHTSLSLNLLFLDTQHIASMASFSVPTSLPSPELIAYSNADRLVAQAATLCAVALATVLLRCYARVVVVKSFGYDDWTMLLAMVITLTNRPTLSITR